MRGDPAGRTRSPTRCPIALAVLTLASAASGSPLAAQPSGTDDGRLLLSVDHFVPVISLAPSIQGTQAQIYVRERVAAGTLARNRSFEGSVVLFVHGAGTPAEVAFDPPHEGTSWMAHLAAAGFDVFSMDMTGYGRSTRPPQMGDPCNLSQAQQADLIPTTIPRPCPASHPHPLTTIASDWHDLDAVVEYLREMRGVDRVALVAWSLGGPRAGGYAALHPEKVASLVLLAPAYSRTRAGDPPPELPVQGTAMTKQSERDFFANWDRQVGCPAQYDPAVARSVWEAMLASDPVGSTWGPGVRRAPNTTVWGWNQEAARSTRIPTLIAHGVLDAQVAIARSRELHEDLASERTVLLELGCASHNAMWEEERRVLYEASVEWLRHGTVDGVESGVLRRAPGDEGGR